MLTRRVASGLFLCSLIALACAPPVVSSIDPIPNASAPPASPTASGLPTYHPADYKLPNHHGPDALTRTSTTPACETCHGADLTGGATANSCDSCHMVTGETQPGPGWRTNCTFCHGGTDNATGAPPRDIDGTADVTLLTFKAHKAHVTDGADHLAYDCTQCHVKPVNALDPNHWFVNDNTPAKAEVDFTAGISDTAVYNGGGSCDTYCHSAGRGTNKTATHNDPTPACDSCHAYKTSTPTAQATMSGAHAKHLQTMIGGSITCVDCHAATVNASGTIIDKAKHVNGLRELMVSAASGITVTGINCDGTCHTKGHNSTLASGKWAGSTPYHPTGYAAATAHGTEMKAQTQDCRTCHGADLLGGSSGVTCDSAGCHTSPTGWRTDCTFCHGTAGGNGAPPRDINGQTNAAMISFKAHQKHTTASEHPAYGCVQCHKNPVNVLSTGHAFDGTKGKAEVSFLGGLSAAGTYAGGGSCSGLYCHGNGLTANGAYTDAMAKPTCSGCHPNLDTPAKWTNMSGFHSTHLNSATTIKCVDCHGMTVNAANAISDATKHVNGVKEVKFSVATITMTGTLCTGACHNFTHSNQDWLGAGLHHPPGFSAAAVHGLASNNQVEACNTCHGATLTGGTTGFSCDSCHKAGWRTNCTYCHGTAGGTGAPPSDIDATRTGSAITFVAHSKHVTASGNHVAFACKQCHNMPTDVLSTNHMFDSTHGKSEVVFTAGLSPAGTYPSARTCANLYCHGTGVANKTATDNGVTPACTGCHAMPNNTGSHGKHGGFKCNTCHSSVSSATNTVISAALHVNGVKEVKFSAGGTYSNGSCSGLNGGNCHGTRSW